MAFVAMIDETTGAVEPGACYGDMRGNLEGIHVSASADTPCGHGPTGTAIGENRPCWCQASMEDPGTQPWRGATAVPRAPRGLGGGAAAPSPRAGGRRHAGSDLRAGSGRALLQLPYGLAHDLNNILTPIIIGTSLIKDHVRDAQAHEILDTTEQCTRRGADIIRRLRTVARGTLGDRKPVAVGDLFRDMARIICETVARNIPLEHDAADSTWASTATARNSSRCR